MSGLAELAAAAPSATTVSAAAARSRPPRATSAAVPPAEAAVSSSPPAPAAATVGPTSDHAQRVWFLTPQGLRPGWSTYVQAGRAGLPARHRRQRRARCCSATSNTDDADGDALVYDNYPGAAKGGTPRVVNFYRPRAGSARRARSSRATSWSPGPTSTTTTSHPADEKTPVPGTRQRRPVQAEHVRQGRLGLCSAHFVCTWDPDMRGLVADQPERPTSPTAFYLASNFHDYLAKPPIGFTPAAGNFSRRGRRPGAAQRAGRRRHRRRRARRQPHRQRQHEHPAGRHPADHADVPVALPGRDRRREDPFVPDQLGASTPASSTTSTPTACPTAWSSTPTATRR